jgi:hypothetical protein
MEKQTKMEEELVESYLNFLTDKEKLNGGFPDTEVMKTALNGQVAFQYEQKCTDIYK